MTFQKSGSSAPWCQRDDQPQPQHTIKSRATARWLGPVAFDRLDVDYVGLHLEHPRGRHGGTVSGLVYFDAPPGAAEFVRASKLVPNNGGRGAAGAGAAAEGEL